MSCLGKIRSAVQYIVMSQYNRTVLMIQLVIWWTGTNILEERTGKVGTLLRNLGFGDILIPFSFAVIPTKHNILRAAFKRFISILSSPLCIGLPRGLFHRLCKVIKWKTGGGGAKFI
jgi:hypothetical protein